MLSKHNDWHSNWLDTYCNVIFLHVLSVNSGSHSPSILKILDTYNFATFWLNSHSIFNMKMSTLAHLRGYNRLLLLRRCYNFRSRHHGHQGSMHGRGKKDNWCTQNVRCRNCLMSWQKCLQNILELYKEHLHILTYWHHFLYMMITTHHNVVNYMPHCFLFG